MTKNTYTYIQEILAAQEWMTLYPTESLNGKQDVPAVITRIYGESSDPSDCTDDLKIGMSIFCPMPKGCANDGEGRIKAVELFHGKEWQYKEVIKKAVGVLIKKYQFQTKDGKTFKYQYIQGQKFKWKKTSPAGNTEYCYLAVSGEITIRACNVPDCCSDVFIDDSKLTSLIELPKGAKTSGKDWFQRTRQ